MVFFIKFERLFFFQNLIFKENFFIFCVFRSNSELSCFYFSFLWFLSGDTVWVIFAQLVTCVTRKDCLIFQILKLLNIFLSFISVIISVFIIIYLFCKNQIFIYLVGKRKKIKLATITIQSWINCSLLLPPLSVLSHDCLSSVSQTILNSGSLPLCFWCLYKVISKWRYTCFYLSYKINLMLNQFK